MTKRLDNITLTRYLNLYFNQLRKYSKTWNLKCLSWNEFRNWAFEDPEYGRIFSLWKQSNFNKSFTPWISRNVSNAGFILGNLSWKNNGYKEYNEELAKQHRKELEEKWDRIKANPRLVKYYQWTGSLVKYHMTRKDWNKLVIESNGYCMLNGEQFKNASNDCHIDHDHNTGEVRGLICARCNHLLAGLEDVKFKKKAEKYLSTVNK